MVTDGTSDDTSVNNKGVNCCSFAPAGVHRCTDTTTSTSTNPPPSRSLTDIKNEIQTVLDLMGPNSTPPYMSSVANTSSEADNEDSTTSLPTKCKQSRSPRSSPKERSSKRSSSMEPNDSVVADHGTISSQTFYDNVDDSYIESCNCCHNYVDPQLVKPCKCLCMVHYNTNQYNATQSQPGEDVQRPTPNKSTSGGTKKKKLLQFLKNGPFDLVLKRSNNNNPCQLYKINMSSQNEEGCPPKRVVFDLVEGIPKPCSSNVATNTIKSPVEKFKTQLSKCSIQYEDQMAPLTCDCKELKNFKNVSEGQKIISCDSDGNTRVDYYYFDHGNAQYFHTTDAPPVMKCELIAEKTERYTTRFWAEFFASVHVVVSFCVSFLLQLFKFILYSILRPLTVGFMQMGSDYCFKPFLTTLFNGLIQPCLIFLYNIATSLRDLCDPIAEGLGYFLKELAIVFRAIRFCTYKNNTNDENCECGRKFHCKGIYKKQKCEC